MTPPPGPSTPRRHYAGFEVLEFAEIDSTNSEALRRAAAGERGPLWLRADQQRAGRGRLGRAWGSQTGNLLATLLTEVSCPPQAASQLSLLAGVAAMEAIGAVAGDRLAPGRLRLKWPNDVLLNGDKIAGILAESVIAGDDRRLLVALGTGINLASHPEDLGRPVTNLSVMGVSSTPQHMLEALMTATASWLTRWRHGENFAEVRKAWLGYGPRSGDPIAINTGAALRNGAFAGLDDTGALLIRDADGQELTFNFGDVADPLLNSRAAKT